MSNIANPTRPHVSLAPRGERAGVKGDQASPQATPGQVDRASDLYRIIATFLALLIGLGFSPSFAAAGTIPAELIQKKEHAQDADLMVSAQALIARVQNGEKLVLIDVRREADFIALHIPGAMNVPLHFIKTKAYLKTSPIVLVDAGLSFHRLSTACRQLRKNGFDARILDGGMNAWSSRGGAMVGEPVRQIDYDIISPSDFFQEKNYPTRIVCDVSTARSEASKQLVPYALHIPLAGDAASQIKAIEKFKSSNIRNGAAAVLVVNADGEGYQNVKHAFNRAGIKDVFYLDGGIRAYEKYLEGLSLSWRPREQRIATNNACQGCIDSVGAGHAREIDRPQMP